MAVYILQDKEIGAKTPETSATDVDEAHAKTGLLKGQTYVYLISA